MSEEVWTDMVEESHNMSNVCDPCYQIFKLVDKLPHVQVATRNHVYVTPDGRMWALNRAGDGYVDLTEKDAIEIDSPDGSITVVKEAEEGKPTIFHIQVSDKLQKAIDDNKLAIETKQDKINIKTGQGLVGINDEVTPRDAITLETLTAGVDEVPSVISPKVLKDAIKQLNGDLNKYKAGKGIEITEDNTINATGEGNGGFVLDDGKTTKPIAVNNGKIELKYDTAHFKVSGDGKLQSTAPQYRGGQGIEIRNNGEIALEPKLFPVNSGQVDFSNGVWVRWRNYMGVVQYQLGGTATNIKANSYTQLAGTMPNKSKPAFNLVIPIIIQGSPNGIGMAVITESGGLGIWNYTSNTTCIVEGSAFAQDRGGY